MQHHDIITCFAFVGEFSRVQLIVQMTFIAECKILSFQVFGANHLIVFFWGEGGVVIFSQYACTLVERYWKRPSSDKISASFEVKVWETIVSPHSSRVQMQLAAYLNICSSNFLMFSARVVSSLIRLFN